MKQNTLLGKIRNILPLLLFLAWPVLLRADSFSVTELAQFNGEDANDWVGIAVFAAGDINGDGYDDLLTSALYDDDGATNAGAVYLTYGSSTPFSGIASLSTADVKFTGAAADDNAKAVAAADVNGDGYDDIFIASEQSDTGGSYSGTVYLIYGEATAFSGSVNLSTADAAWYGQAYERLGNALSTGDINGDGYADILIGAYYNSTCAASAGAAYLIYGDTTVYSGSSTISSTAVQFSGCSSAEKAGYTVSIIGDTNADGNDDLLVASTPYDIYTGWGESTVYLLYGQTSPLSDLYLSSADALLVGHDTSRSGAHYPLGNVGDLDGDGYDEIAIGEYLGYGYTEGLVYILYGQSTQLSGTYALETSADAILSGSSSDNGCCLPNNSPGDLNNDGYDDLVIGEMYYDDTTSNVGAAHIFLGTTSRLAGSYSVTDGEHHIIGESTYDYLGRSSSFGDINSDGFSDLFIGAHGTDDAASWAGAAHVGYFYVDSDLDGVAGTDGLLDGTDCNDEDSTVSAEQTFYADADGDTLGDLTVTTTSCSATPPSGYVVNDDDTDDTIANNGVEISGDGVDNDGDGIIDEVNTVSENGIHPGYGSYDPTDVTLANSAIVSVRGVRFGDIVVRFADDSRYHYDVYSSSSTTTTFVRRYRHTGYARVGDPDNPGSVLVNMYTGEVL